MARRLRLPGTREVRAALDESDQEGGDAVVVACPPHPQMGGDRRDARLRAVSRALGTRGVDCLRIDYGPWDAGRGEQTDARNALAWCRDEYAAVGLFGYSFGGGVALLAAAAAFADGRDDPPDAVAALAPPATIEGLDVAAAVDGIECPLQVVYGERDDAVDSHSVADRARQQGGTVTALQADHFYVGQQDRVGESVASFFRDHL